MQAEGAELGWAEVDAGGLVPPAALASMPQVDAPGELADRVKAEVPIWKEQTLADGATEWVGIDG